MGQARQRGDYDKRKAEGVQARLEREQAEKQRRIDREVEARQRMAGKRASGEPRPYCSPILSTGVFMYENPSRR